MGEWMSILETPSEFIARRALRQNVRGEQTGLGLGRCDAIVLYHDGDIANLDEIEGIDFSVVNQDLIEYIANTFG